MKCLFSSKYVVCSKSIKTETVFTKIEIEVNNGKESDCMEKIEKLSTPKGMNLRRKVNVKTFWF